ncbi:septum site-determining protein MinC [Brevibacillus laterosporus]|uniref:septum site-determining protein MinC n=1 Tax=Brevibacillus laterosporus TaxID=1465 RepID=UPI00264B073C|nr:septum site-determining protein MinC [Brevibacillus laterosporus]MDN9012540.1 septum site-determining protein MinC [Brevibacillus laterosporus]MDO0939847.1 septum site-determining protein MinC [Brevibacillus laterosporus]
MNTAKSKVIIKGTKDGLVFFMDDTCSFSELLDDLRDKIEHSHPQFFSGPLIRITLKLGKRYCTPEQQEELTQIIRMKGNLVIHMIDSDVILKEEAYKEAKAPGLIVQTNTVRSGQVLEYDGDILLLGDVNPGGTIRSTGSIFVLGNLRGVAQAGTNGDKDAVIASACLHPTQLRIAEVISRPGDEWSDYSGTTEFAYLEEDRMVVAKMNFLHRLRSDLGKKKA